MKNVEKRQTALTLFRAGNDKKKIARLLEMDIKTIRRIIVTDDGEAQPKTRSDSIDIDEEILRDVYHRCEGYIQRTHEVLIEEYNLDIGYSTLTRKVREAGLGEKNTSRSFHVPDAPGEEMQQDTSPYTLEIGGRKTKVICSGIYMRYSKMRYIKFYRRFDRFAMKCFMEEALGFWKYCASVCIIDNTNLAIWYGSGHKAVFALEMVKFARNYGFEWKAHEIGHSNRKAGKERNFWTVETNFFPGRTFSSLEDLNAQALTWATDRYAKRPQSKTGLIPLEAFEYEKSFLTKLPDFISPVSREHNRGLDEYGYAAFRANYYWVPEYNKTNERINEVKIIEYTAHIVLYCKYAELVRYKLPADGIHNEKFAPDGVCLRYKPKHRKKTSMEEERELRSLGQCLIDYVDFVKSQESGIHFKNQYLKRLYLLCKKMSEPLRQRTLERALKYRVNSIDTISRMASQVLNQEACTAPEPEIQHDYMERDAYIKGRFCDENAFGDLPSLLNRHKEDLGNI